MKKMLAIAALSVFGFSANAQISTNLETTANQTVNLALSNVMDIAFVSNNSTTGPNVNFDFATINDYVNGIESAPQQIRVRSNKTFIVKVKTNAVNFTYTGNAPVTPVMPVAGVLSLKMTANATGGTVHLPFSMTNYYTLREFDEYLLANGAAGVNQTFDVQYLATPGFSYPAGNYTVDVIYTATQQ